VPHHAVPAVGDRTHLHRTDDVGCGTVHLAHSTVAGDGTVRHHEPGSQDEPHWIAMRFLQLPPDAGTALMVMCQ
jgi:hypothetical protein